MNLALPFFGFSEPIAAQKKKFGNTEWTLWDRLEFKDDPTLKEFVAWFKTNHNLDVSMISQGVSMLWSSFTDRKKVRVHPPGFVTSPFDVFLECGKTADEIH